MALDPSKLKTYLASSEPRPGRKSLPVAKAGSKLKVRPMADGGANRAALINGDDTEPDALSRLLSKEVGYMEVLGKAGAFSCDACRSYDSGEGRCDNEAVRAPVSDDHGCCNLWWPADESAVTFPPPSQG
jgi:hypothetical protein